MWLAFVGLPILGRLGELACVLAFQRERRAAQAWERGTHNLFVASGAREAGHRSLWKKPNWEYRPGARFEKKVAGLQYLVQINSHGFRTPEFDAKKSPGSVRVICVGGSTTVQGRTNDLTYPALLQEALRARHPTCPVEVLNFGISATDSTRWLKDSGTLFGYAPDIVVQYDAVNDIMGRVLPKYATDHPGRELLSRSQLLGRLLPPDPRDLDLEGIVDNQVAMASLCRSYGATHLAASFASPDYDRASPGEQASLDVSVSEGWTPWPGTIHLRRYRDYAAILARYNALFERATTLGRVRGVMIHRELSDPELFVDICHMTEGGIAHLAQGFVDPVAEAVAGRCP
jgi:hypothetical protein